MSNPALIDGRQLVVHGFVQGVGFRPFVARLARRLGVTGAVRNEARGVVIDVEGPTEAVEAFVVGVRVEAPPAARVESIESIAVSPRGAATFEIQLSGPPAAPNVRVPRDLATCADCAAEVADAGDRRHGYPFTNCTNCGPRFTILEGLPYDRLFTSMARFAMCADCAREYAEPSDRRFHAEPIACPACGPRAELRDRAGVELCRDTAAIEAAAAALRAGRVVALKGLGGFQLLVRADDEAAVNRLRMAKRRPTKPFAVMVADLDSARLLGRATAEEERELESAENPIVLVGKSEGAGMRLAESAAPHVGRVGLFLPTTPLHRLILDAAGLPLVATSGNRGDEPIATDEKAATRELAGIADLYLVHDRPIARRADDSVVQMVAGRRQVIRLARGLAPMPLENLERWIQRRGGAAPTLAVGGQQKVAVAFWSGEQAILGPHIGDLDTVEARADLESQSQRLTSLYQFVPERLACDLHPDYVTTRWAEAQALPTTRVQHHHAHAAAAMAEHDLLDREVLALTWDGTGFGTDGTIWGAELMRARAEGYERLASLWPIPLLGGERAIREPWRLGAAAVLVALGAEGVDEGWLSERLGIAGERVRRLRPLLERPGGLVTWSSGLGRLFDAVAALVLGVREVSHEGEAAAWLEAAAEPGERRGYSMATTDDAPPAGAPLPRGDWRPIVRDIVDHLREGVAPGVIAARFHNTLAEWAGELVARFEGGDVVLGGGCWINRRLAESVIRELEARGRRAHLAAAVPPNDGGLAVGQLVVAVARGFGGSA
jgi:hydrogenase maturation protein HypF